MHSIAFLQVKGRNNCNAFYFNVLKCPFKWNAIFLFNHNTLVESNDSRYHDRSFYFFQLPIVYVNKHNLLLGMSENLKYLVRSQTGNFFDIKMDNQKISKFSNLSGSQKSRKFREPVMLLYSLQSIHS